MPVAILTLLSPRNPETFTLFWEKLVSRYGQRKMYNFEQQQYANDIKIFKKLFKIAL